MSCKSVTCVLLFIIFVIYLTIIYRVSFMPCVISQHVCHTSVHHMSHAMRDICHLSFIFIIHLSIICRAPLVTSVISVSSLLYIYLPYMHPLSIILIYDICHNCDISLHIFLISPHWLSDIFLHTDNIYSCFYLTIFFN